MPDTSATGRLMAMIAPTIGFQRSLNRRNEELKARPTSSG
jgi:hypothetical protein